jgi:hypothetical protein
VGEESQGAGVTPDGPNWVERRAAIERTRREQAPALWNAVRGALQDACDSFNALYGAEAGKVTCELENGQRVRVTRVVRVPGTAHGTPRQVLVTYHADDYTIAATSRVKAQIQADADGVYLEWQRARIEPDALCQTLLEPVLFETRA